MYLKKIILFIVVVVSIYACNNHNKKHSKSNLPYIAYLFQGNDKNVFRNIDFNTSIDVVKKTETSKLFDATTDHLFYELTFPKDSTTFSEYANLQYFFNENNKLDIIIADVFFADSTQQTIFFSDLLSYFDDNFDKQDNNDTDYPIWKATFKDPSTEKEFDYTIALKEKKDENAVSIEYMLINTDL